MLQDLLRNTLTVLGGQEGTEGRVFRENGDSAFLRHLAQETCVSDRTGGHA